MDLGSYMPGDPCDGCDMACTGCKHDIEKEIARKKYHKELDDRRKQKMSKVANVKFNLAGVTFTNDDGVERKKVIMACKMDTKIMLIREPYNQYDANAIAVVADGVQLDTPNGPTVVGQLGYIPKQYASVLAPFIDAGRMFDAKLHEFGMHDGRPFCVVIVNER